MKPAHKALHLRHHKHTGKLLPHKHTSYRVLFLLMLAPIFMMALVGHLALASDYTVSATVPAPIPGDAPVITAPDDNATISSGEVVVSGTCPVISPAVIIAVYDGDAVIGSTQCGADGKFSVTVSLAYGTHTIVATVITVTGQTGASSTPITVTRPRPPATQNADASGSDKPDAGALPTATINIGNTLKLPLHIISTNAYLLMDADGRVTWHGTFSGGTAPYSVRIEWGDGTTDTYSVADQTAQAFPHHYQSKRAYNATIRVTDADGSISFLNSVVVTFALGFEAAGFLDNHFQQPPALVAFIQEYIVQIYIGALSGLTFLWYLEHGRHHALHVMAKLSRYLRGRHSYR